MNKNTPSLFQRDLLLPKPRNRPGIPILIHPPNHYHHSRLPPLVGAGRRIAPLKADVTEALERQVMKFHRIVRSSASGRRF
jgi:hypothetical protein